MRRKMDWDELADALAFMFVVFVPAVLAAGALVVILFWLGPAAFVAACVLGLVAVFWFAFSRPNRDA